MTSFRPSRDPNNLAFSPIQIDETLAFESAATRLGYEVWCDMAKSKALPDRRDLNPSHFGSYLPNFNLFDLHLEDGELVSLSARVVGGEFEAVFGNLKGKILKDVLPGNVIARWMGAAKAVLGHDGPLRATGRVAYENKDHLSFELMLALMGDGGNEPAVLFAVGTFKTD